jgi:hypothetical protein
MCNVTHRNFVGQTLHAGKGAVNFSLAFLLLLLGRFCRGGTLAVGLLLGLDGCSPFRSAPTHMLIRSGGLQKNCQSGVRKLDRKQETWSAGAHQPEPKNEW